MTCVYFRHKLFKCCLKLQEYGLKYYILLSIEMTFLFIFGIFLVDIFDCKPIRLLCLFDLHDLRCCWNTLKYHPQSVVVVLSRCNQTVIISYSISFICNIIYSISSPFFVLILTLFFKYFVQWIIPCSPALVPATISWSLSKLLLIDDVIVVICFCS